VYLPHYFERTGTGRSDVATSFRHFPEWLETIGDVLAFAERQPAADAGRIGIIGISLGAYLGLSIATRDARVKTVVDFYGGLPQAFVADAGKLPPTLILHGDADRIVPVDEAHRLQRLLAEHGVPHETRIYPGEGHLFTPLTALDAARRTMSFLGRWV
jgi:carboxymethylenebutenolidase